jgi:heterodisulfide reductase subunit C
MNKSETLVCFQCGTCHSSCPSGRYTSLNVRKIVRDSMKRDVSDVPELWMCTTCYNCQERCPRGIKVTDAIFLIRNEAVRKGRILPAHRKVCEFLMDTGHAIPLDEKHAVIRELIGLGIPETVNKYPEALAEVKALLKSTGFDELISK